jgi:hypothetical protein
MNEATGRRKPTAIFIVKLLVVLSFPFSGEFNPSYFEFEWLSLLLRVRSFQNVAIVLDYALLFGLFIMLPCLAFEYQLNSKPISAAVRRRAALACVLSWLINMTLSLTFFIEPFIMYISAIGYVLPLSIAFFVILPLINRESTLRSISPEHHNISYRFIRSIQRKQFRREKILSGLLWIGVVFCPFLMYINWGWWGPSFQFMSLYSQIIYTQSNPWFYVFEFQIYFIASTALIFPIMALMSSVRFVFIRDIFRFQNGHVSRSRLVSVAVLGELLPSAIITLLALGSAPSFAYIPLYYPIPFLPVIGFLYLKFSKVEPLKRELWPEYEHRMWFESERWPYSLEPVDESIKVPLTYLLISQVRKRRNR